MFAFSLLAVPAFSAEYYVSPTGTAAGNGSISAPWALATAFAHPAAVRPGDTIWVRGGTYTGLFVSRLNGTATAPIKVRAYAGERPILEHGGAVLSSYILEVQGSYTWFWGLEIRATKTERGGERSGGLNVFGPGMKFINNIIHDTGGVGVWNGSDNTEMYGNIIFDNGYEGGDRGHGHSIYSQNRLGTKRIVDNIYFNSFSHGIHIYGSEQAWLDNYHIEGNIGFNNGILSRTGITTNILLGGGKVANNSVFLNNAMFFTPGALGNGRAAILGYGGICNNTNVQGNTFSGSPTAMILNCTNVAMSGNTFVGAISGFSQATYPSNTYLTSQSNGGTKIYIRPNQYEPGRAHVAVYNWAGLGSVGLDLSGVLNTGDSFEVVDAQDYFGAPIYTGTYAGTLVYVTTLNTSVYRSFGNVPVPPVHTPSIFNAFLVRRTATGGGGAAPADRPPTVTAGSNQTIMLPNTAALSGSVLDQGSPAGLVTVSWAKVSGPGTVTFSNQVAAQTNASFSAAGTYVLSFTANNGAMFGSAQVTITVNSANRAPTVSAGVNQTITLPNGASVSGTVTDPGSPAGTISTTWAKVSGPGTVSFSNAAAAATTANFSSAGVYVLSFTASNGTLSGSAQVTITVNPAVTVTNRPPTVSAGASQTITLPSGASLAGSVTDPGFPTGTIATTWAKVSGPGTVTFANAAAAQTTATFSAAGSYVLSFTANNGTLSASAQVAITVNAAASASGGTGGTATTPLTQALRVNAGGADYRTSAGLQFAADANFTGGTPFSATTGAIGYTNDLAVYGTQRQGDFTYKVPVKNGIWSLQLNFAELQYTSAGKRVFDVYVNGVKVSGGYDIFARVGGARIALNQGFTVSVTQGFIEVRFASVVGQAAVNGIQFIPVSLTN